MKISVGRKKQKPTSAKRPASRNNGIADLTALVAHERSAIEPAGPEDARRSMADPPRPRRIPDEHDRAA